MIFGNLGDDSIAGGAGNDRINVVGGGSDVVRCGPGDDRVFADAARPRRGRLRAHLALTHRIGGGRVTAFPTLRDTRSILARRGSLLQNTP